MNNFPDRNKNVVHSSSATNQNSFNPLHQILKLPSKGQSTIQLSQQVGLSDDKKELGLVLSNKPASSPITSTKTSTNLLHQTLKLPKKAQLYVQVAQQLVSAGKNNNNSTSVKSFKSVAPSPSSSGKIAASPLLQTLKLAPLQSQSYDHQSQNPICPKDNNCIVHLGDGPSVQPSHITQSLVLRQTTSSSDLSKLVNDHKYDQYTTVAESTDSRDEEPYTEADSHSSPTQALKKYEDKHDKNASTETIDDCNEDTDTMLKRKAAGISMRRSRAIILSDSDSDPEMKTDALDSDDEPLVPKRKAKAKNKEEAENNNEDENDATSYSELFVRRSERTAKIQPEYRGLNEPKSSPLKDDSEEEDKDDGDKDDGDNETKVDDDTEIEENDGQKTPSSAPSVDTPPQSTPLPISDDSATTQAATSTNRGRGRGASRGRGRGGTRSRRRGLVRGNGRSARSRGPPSPPTQAADNREPGLQDDGTWVEYPVVDEELGDESTKEYLKRVQRKLKRNPEYNPHAPELVKRQEDDFKKRVELAMEIHAESNVRAEPISGVEEILGFGQQTGKKQRAKKNKKARKSNKNNNGDAVSHQEVDHANNHGGAPATLPSQNQPNNGPADLSRYTSSELLAAEALLDLWKAPVVHRAQAVVNQPGRPNSTPFSTQQLAYRSVPQNNIRDDPEAEAAANTLVQLSNQPAPTDALTGRNSGTHPQEVYDFQYRNPLAPDQLDGARDNRVALQLNDWVQTQPVVSFPHWQQTQQSYNEYPSYCMAEQRVEHPLLDPAPGQPFSRPTGPWANSPAPQHDKSQDGRPFQN